MTKQDQQGPLDDQQDRIDQLLISANSLMEEVEELAAGSGRQFVNLARTAKINRRLIWFTIVGGIVQLFTVVVLAFTVIGVVENTQRLDTQQTTQRQRALCPLYGIFMDSKSPEGRAAAPDKEKYDHAFEVIAEGYAVLECDRYLKESGRDAW